MRDSGIRRPVFVIAACCLFLILVDFCFGKVMDFALHNAKGGDTYNKYYINILSRDSVIILGSSRANHHYIPDSLSSATGVSVYNYGIDGNGSILAYCFLLNRINRGDKPDLVIYDFFAPFDLLENNDRSNALNHIKPFYKNEGIGEVVDDISAHESLKLQLASYRYNSIFIQILSDNISPKHSAYNGFKPLKGSISTDFEKKERFSGLIDPVKEKYFQRILDLCQTNGINIVFVISPYYHNVDVREIDAVIELFRKQTEGRATRLLDFRNNPEFTGNMDLFVDPSHMNADGAKAFTEMLIDSLTYHGYVSKHGVSSEKIYIR